MKEVIQHSEQPKDGVVSAIATAIKTHSCAAWPEKAKADLAMDLYSKLNFLSKSHPKWDIGKGEAIHLLEFATDPRRAEQSIKVDPFRRVKRQLLSNYPQLNKSSMNLVVKIFGESLTILSTGMTKEENTRQLAKNIQENKYTVHDTSPVKLPNPADAGHFQGDANLHLFDSRDPQKS